MQEGKTIGQLMEEMRQKAGAQNYHGHDYMDKTHFLRSEEHTSILPNSGFLKISIWFMSCLLWHDKRRPLPAACVHIVVDQ